LCVLVVVVQVLTAAEVNACVTAFVEHEWLLVPSGCCLESLEHDWCTRMDYIALYRMNWPWQGDPLPENQLPVGV
jgi:hypothetical protein